VQEKVIITCAVTGSAPTVGKHPAIPVTPEEIARAAIDAGRAGAAVAHIHVRDPKTGGPSRDVALFREVVERIRASDSDIVLNLSCGAGGRYVPGTEDPLVPDPASTLADPLERVAHVVALKPEICSLDIATMNMGEVVFMNTPAHLRRMAEAIRAAGTRPELEVFDVGHLRLAGRLIEEGLIEAPPLFQIVLGVAWGAPATAQALAYMASLVPEGANWAAFGISRQSYPMVAMSTLLGGHVRVGLEDNLYLERGVFAPDNAALVAKAVQLIRLMGAEIASPEDARAILALRGSQ
jgi:uncharacterized protein (DUF849 family)